ncbi:MAG: hypothetical protein AB1430_05275 [Pseudomonadota bacterium]
MTLSTAILGRSEVVQAWRTLLQRALAEGTRELWCSDVDFADWPLNEPALVEALVRWAKPHHRLHLLAQHYDEMPRRHPRFVRWRRDWGHLVQAWCVEDLDASQQPCLLIAGDRSIELLDREHWRAVASEEAADAQRARERLDAILQRSAPGFAATTLGL